MYLNNLKQDMRQLMLAHSPFLGQMDGLYYSQDRHIRKGAGMDKQENVLYVEEELCLQEQKFLEVIRGMDHGEVRVVITDGKPIRIEEIKKNIEL